MLIVAIVRFLFFLIFVLLRFFFGWFCAVSFLFISLSVSSVVCVLCCPRDISVDFFLVFECVYSCCSECNIFFPFFFLLFCYVSRSVFPLCRAPFYIYLFLLDFLYQCHCLSHHFLFVVTVTFIFLASFSFSFLACLKPWPALLILPVLLASGGSGVPLSAVLSVGTSFWSSRCSW